MEQWWKQRHEQQRSETDTGARAGVTGAITSLMGAAPDAANDENGEGKPQGCQGTTCGVAGDLKNQGAAESYTPRGREDGSDPCLSLADGAAASSQAVASTTTEVNLAEHGSDRVGSKESGHLQDSCCSPGS